MKKSKTFKRTLSLLLCVIMVFGSAPLAGLVGIDLPSIGELFAQKADAAISGTCGSSVTYSFDESTGTLTIGGTGKMTDYVSLMEYSAYRPWEDYTDTIKKVIIGNNVTSIGGNAFAGCTSLESITIPDSVTSIGHQAFYFCTSLTSITIPDSVTSIGYYAFFYCTRLESITIPNSVTSIGYGAFYSCTGLESITFPDSVTSIGNAAFFGTAYYNNEANWENDVLYIGNHLIEAKETISGSYAVKDGTKTIADYAFGLCANLENITIPNSVTSIGFYAFNSTAYYSNESNWDNDELYIGNHLIKAKYTISGSYTVKDGTKTIADDAFYGCASLESIIIPDSVTHISDYAFQFCTSLESITIPDSVTSIGIFAFCYCTSLASVTIPNSVTSIGDYAFMACENLESITVDLNNKNYSSDEYGVLFNKDKTELIQYPIGNERTSYNIDSVKRIDDYAFVGCTSLKSITIADNVKEIGSYAFSGCTSLESVTFGDDSQLTDIAQSAFYGCTSLENITIPDSVTSIGESAFEETAYYNNESNWENDVLYIGNHLIEAKETISGSYAVKNGTKTIADDTFGGCKNLTSITIPDGVTSIGHQAFYGCTSLENITIPDSVTIIGIWAFHNCTSLKSVTVDSNNKNYSSDEYGVFFNKSKTKLIQYPIANSRTSYVIPDDVISIAFGAFEDCTNLKSVTFGDDSQLTSIGFEAFSDCANLTSIMIPVSVTSIGYYAFYECTSLKNLVFDDDNQLTSIGDYAFNRCTSLESIVIPDSVTSIGNSAFNRCTSLESITIPDSVTSFGDGAFEDCTSLTDVYYTGTESKWNSIAIGDYNECLTNATIHFKNEKPAESTTKPAELTTKPVESTTKPVESTTKPAESTTKPAESTTKPAESTTKPVESTTKPTDPTEPTIKPTTPTDPDVVIQPSQSSISYGDSIILHVDASKIPAGGYIKWTADNGNFSYDASADGSICKITPKSSGTTTFTATVYDKDGNVVSSDTQQMKSKAGVWEKIIAFFKKLFGLTKTYPNAFKYIF